MEERLLFNRVALKGACVIPRNVELATPVEADLAYPWTAIGDGAAVTARKAAQSVAFELLVEFALPNVLIENLAQRSHKTNNKKSHSTNEFYAPVSTSPQRDYQQQKIVDAHRALLALGARCRGRFLAPFL